MPIDRLPGMPPVTPVLRGEGGDNDPASDSERKRPEHQGIAEEYSRAGSGQQTLSEMAQMPLPLNVAEVVAKGTTVTISEEGRQAAELDAQVVDEQPSANPGVRHYQAVRKLER